MPDKKVKAFRSRVGIFVGLVVLIAAAALGAYFISKKRISASSEVGTCPVNISNLSSTSSSWYVYVLDEKNYNTVSSNHSAAIQTFDRRSSVGALNNLPADSRKYYVVGHKSDGALIFANKPMQCNGAKSFDINANLSSGTITVTERTGSNPQTNTGTTQSNGQTRCVLDPVSIKPILLTRQADGSWKDNNGNSYTDSNVAIMTETPGNCGNTGQGTGSTGSTTLPSSADGPLQSASQSIKVSAKCKLGGGKETEAQYLEAKYQVADGKETVLCQTNNTSSCESKIGAQTKAITVWAEKRINGKIYQSTKQTFKPITASERFISNLSFTNLTADQCSLSADYTAASNPNLQAPTVNPNFPVGNNSISISAVRFSYASNTNYTPIGGAAFELTVFVDPNYVQSRTSYLPFIGTAFAASTDQAQSSIESAPYSNRVSAYDSQIFKSLRDNWSILTKKTKRFTVKGTIPDNGINSKLLISDLPKGIYIVKLSKENYDSSQYTFVLADNEKEVNIENLPMTPQNGAEPPSINENNVERLAETDIYGAGGKWAYKESCPWYGWQPNTNTTQGLNCNQPNYGSYGIPAQVDPQTGLPNFGLPTGQNLWQSSSLCQSLNSIGGNINSEYVGLGAAVSGLVKWIDPSNGPRTIGTFAKNVLGPGLAAYYLGKGLQSSGNVVNLGLVNSLCNNLLGGYGNPSSIPIQCTNYYKNYKPATCGGIAGTRCASGYCQTIAGSDIGTCVESNFNAGCLPYLQQLMNLKF